MSLQDTRALYAGHEQADAAALVANGVEYRCVIYLSRASWRIEAVCVRVQPDGTEVEVFRNAIAEATSTEIEDTNGMPLDCPKLIAVGTTFVAHWLQATAITLVGAASVRDWLLYRATMDMTSFSETAWNNRGSAGLLETHALYDVDNVIGTTTDFVVARYTAASVTTVQRFSGFDWIDFDWTCLGATSHAPHILGVYAHDSDNDVVWTFEHGTDGRCYSVRCDADTGLNMSAAVQTFSAFAAAVDTESDVANWVQVSHYRTAANRVFVMAEVQGASNLEDGSSVGAPWVHHVVGRDISSNDATVTGAEHWCANVTMMSRLFGYANGTTSVGGTSPNLYVALGYRSIVDTQEWSQSYAYICNVDYSMWNSVATGAGLRPRPVSTYWTLGVPDCRTSGWHPETTGGAIQDVHMGGPTRRMNHISHAAVATSSGVDVKTRTLAVVAWSNIGTQSYHDSIAGTYTSITGVERASVGMWTFYIEDPWQIYRDATDPTQPVDNFAQPYSRAMHQSCAMGRGLFVGGGTPQVYDGSSMVECGFLWKPEIIGYDLGTSGSLGADGIAGTGTYSWYAVYSWTDAAGQTHRSGPSNIVTVELSGTFSSVALYIRTMTMSLKDADAFYPMGHPIAIEVFRTSADSATFLRVFGSSDSPYTTRDTPVNDPEAVSGYVTVTDGLLDRALRNQGAGPYQLNEAGELASVNGQIPDVLPAVSVVATHQNRVFCTSAIDPSMILFSDEVLPDLGGDFYSIPTFSTRQTYRIGEIGEITAMHSMGPAIVVFTRSSIHVMQVADAGSGLLSIVSQLVHDDVGCVDPRTVVLYAQGLGFQSQRGYMLLSRGLEVGYGFLARSRDSAGDVAGAAIEDDIALAGNVRSATLVENKHQILLATNGRPAVTQTWTGTIVAGGSSAGVWTISGMSQDVEVTLGAGLTPTQIADALQTAVQTLIDADAPDTLQFEVDSVSSPAGTIVLVLLSDIDLSITGDGPGANTITFAVAEAIETRPWVLAYDYLVQQWSRWELPQTSSTTRMAEVVSGCVWRGDGGSCHVVLAQGAILVQRQKDDALAYADETSVADVGIPLDLTWAWWHLGGIAGAQVLWEISVQTRRYAQADVSAELQYDYSGAYDGQQVPITAYSWPLTGDASTPADIRLRPGQTRARAHRLRLYESVGVTTERTMSVVGLTLTAGVRQVKTMVLDNQRGDS